MRPKEKLAGAARHVLYEVWMLQETTRALTSEDLPRAHRNALIESFAIHARNLLHFVDPVSPKRSDVLAEHYLNDPSVWYEARGELPPSLLPVRRRVNKEVVHLTYDRLNLVEEARRWDFNAISHDLTAMYARLVGLLEPAECALLRPPGSPGEPSPE